MPRAPRICSVHGCPNIATYRTWCQAHARQREQHQRATTPTKRTRTHTERRRRAAVVAEWRRIHGDWCPGYKVPAHRATDLTAEHVTAVADGGAPDGPLVVLCRSCNSRHGAETARLAMHN